MRLNLLISVLISLLSFLSCVKNDKKESDQEKGSHIFQDSVESVLNRKIPEWQSEYHVPCVGVGLIENGKIKLIKVYGEHQLGVKAPQNTIFNVASITKTIVAITTLKLVDAGQWDLDEPLYHYWVDPDIKNDPLHKKLTTRHVLSHTTGFKNWRRMHPEKKLTFDFEPGSQYQYSGEGMEYLATALEKKFNKKLDKLVDSIVFQPLKMNDATLAWLADKDTLRFAHWYDGDGQAHNTYYKTYWISAADDLLISVEDLARFGISIMDSNSLSKELYDEMVSPQAKIHNNASQGLGWTIVKGLPNGEYVINHDGGDIGVATTIILLPKSKSGIIVFTNADNGRILCNKIIRESINFGDDIVTKLYWGSEIPKIIEIPDQLLDEYSGAYETNLGRTINFYKKDNSLKIEADGIPQLSLHPESENTFFPMDFEVHFVFTRDENGVVKAFELYQSGKVTLTGKKK